MSVKNNLENDLVGFGEKNAIMLSYFSNKIKLNSSNMEKGVTKIESWIQLQLMYQMEVMLKYNDVDYEVSHSYNSNKRAQSNKAVEKSNGIIDLVYRPANNSTLNRLVAVELKVKHTKSRAIKSALMDLVKTRRYKLSDITNGGNSYRAVYSVCIYKKVNNTSYEEIASALGAKELPFGDSHKFMVLGWEGTPSDEPKKLWEQFNILVRDQVIKGAKKLDLKLTD